MADPKSDETYSEEEETVARREAAIKRMLATPHKPHKEQKKGAAKPTLCAHLAAILRSSCLIWRSSSTRLRSSFTIMLPWRFACISSLLAELGTITGGHMTYIERELERLERALDAGAGDNRYSRNLCGPSGASVGC